MSISSQQLANVAPDLYHIVKRPLVLSKPRFSVSEIKLQTVMVPMRDGVNLATDLYSPPSVPAPAVVMRTPYDRASDETVKVFFFLARRGYIGVSQDCRGTGGSEPDYWNYYLNEPEDGYDTIEWITKQSWFDGFIGSAGGSYVGQTQWQMAAHPKMTTIVPEVSGLGVAINTAHLHMFVNAYARSMGHGEGKVDVPYYELEEKIKDETLATGYFNEPLHKPFSEALLNRFPNLRTLPPMQAKRWLWEYYCALSCADRVEFVKQAMGVEGGVTILEVEALNSIFGHQISHDRHTLPHPRMDELVGSLHSPVLFSTGWYDWGLNDALATWELLKRSGPEPIRSNSRLFIAPSAHNAPGYHEGMENHPELLHAHRFTTNFELLLSWYDTVREKRANSWPRVVYYLMGANEWRAASDWPIPEARQTAFYFSENGKLSSSPPKLSSSSDRYSYDPNDPTPTIGGSIVSYMYPPGSVDVSEVQKRSDLLTYTTDLLDHDLDVVGPLTLILYASSSAVDTDFAGRLSDVFPDGRAIQLQHTILRARYRNGRGDPELLEPHRIYKFEIDMWATGNRFKVGHRLRVDLSSADFPHFDRNTNLGGKPGNPVHAMQTVFRDSEHPSHLVASVIDHN
ncbi:MAG TPA: CocE/NonD family hydrolase [Nitrososphaerales archaeon]|nr:CocE/NonD family hydrolase [Nitrososphaerales archaeon]